MTIGKGVFQTLFGRRVLVFKQIQSPNIVLVRDHLSHTRLLVQLPSFYGSQQVLAQA